VLEPASSDPLVGRTLVERYLIEEMLGEGGMGRVYRGRHLSTGRSLAIKVLHSEHSRKDKMVLRFQREAQAASRLMHPNVVGVVDFGETDDDLLFLVMELVEGATLRRLIRNGPMSGNRALALFAQLCDGLGHAHGRGLIHRDLKPDNILVEPTAGGELARIVDFGIAVVRDPAADDADQQRLTTEGQVLGTPHYMAPEQARGMEIDERADLYALGVILYEMLAGTLPFVGHPALVAQMHVLVEPPPMAVCVPGLEVDPRIEALARRLMAKRRDDRPGSAREIGALVQQLRDERAAELQAMERALSPPWSPPTEPMPRRAEGTTADAAASPRARVATRSRWLPIAAALAVIALAAAALAAIGWRPGAGPGAPPTTAVSAADEGGRTRRAVADAIDPPPGGRPIAASPAAADDQRDATDRAARTDGDGGDRDDREPRHKRRRGATAAQPTLGEQYGDVGKQLDQLIARRGVAAAARLEERYLAIRLMDALRSPALAAETARQLADLRDDIRRALRRHRRGR
jgi:serine/threonine-protein kinase